MIADGPPRRVLELISEGAAELVLAEQVVIEFSRVLVDKLEMAVADVDDLVALLDEIGSEHADAPEHVDAVSGDSADDRILAAALGGGAEVLVSGDTKHLLPLGDYRGMRIMRPQDFLAELIPPT